MRASRTSPSIELLWVCLRYRAWLDKLTLRIARACASASVLPTLRSPEKPGALAQGDSQLQALHQLVEDGSIRAVLHAGPAVYKLFGKSVAECEMTPGQVKHLLIGLKLVQMPDDTCKLIGIVVSSPKLKGPNAEPAATVQTTMGVINVLRVLSGLAEILVASSPLWGRTCRASHNELARLSTLMPRLAEAFKADTSAQAKWEARQLSPAMAPSWAIVDVSCWQIASDKCPFSPHTTACPCSGPPIEANATGHLEVTCIECKASVTMSP